MYVNCISCSYKWHHFKSFDLSFFFTHLTIANSSPIYLQMPHIYLLFFIPPVTNMIQTTIALCPNCWNVVLNCLLTISLSLSTLHINSKVFFLIVLSSSQKCLMVSMILIYLIHFHWVFIVFLTLVFEDMAIYENFCPAQLTFQWGKAGINEKSKIITCRRNCYAGKIEKEKEVIQF